MKRNKIHCEYCGSNNHKSKDCRIGKFGWGEIEALRYGIEIDASDGLGTLFKAIEIIHKDTQKG